MAAKNYKNMSKILLLKLAFCILNESAVDLQFTNHRMIYS